MCKKVSSFILNPDFQAYPQNVSDYSRLIKACLIILQSTWKRKSMLVSTEYIGAWSILPAYLSFLSNDCVMYNDRTWLRAEERTQVSSFLLLRVPKYWMTDLDFLLQTLVFLVYEYYISFYTGVQYKRRRRTEPSEEVTNPRCLFLGQLGN